MQPRRALVRVVISRDGTKLTHTAGPETWVSTVTAVGTHRHWRRVRALVPPVRYVTVDGAPDVEPRVIEALARIAGRGRP